MILPFFELEEEASVGIREEDYKFIMSLMMMMMMKNNMGLLTRERDQIKRKRNIHEEKMSPLMGVVTCICQ